MIASLGGAVVSAKGDRNYPGSGGYVGGLSMRGGNWAYFTGAGHSYNKFTPMTTSALPAPEPNPNPEYPNYPNYPQQSPEIPTGGGGGGGGTTTTSPAPAPSPIPVFIPPSSPYRGLSQITSGGNQVISTMNAIYAQYQAGNITLQQALLAAQQYSGYFNNPNIFYQAQHGRDASALANFRRQALSIVNAIRNWFLPKPATTTPTTGGGVECLVNCGGQELPSTEIPTQLPQGILDFLTGLGSSARTNVEAPPNLYQFAPTGTGASNTTMRNAVIVVALVAVAYWLYKKYA